MQGATNASTAGAGGADLLIENRVMQGSVNAVASGAVYQFVKEEIEERIGAIDALLDLINGEVV